MGAGRKTGEENNEWVAMTLALDNTQVWDEAGCSLTHPQVTNLGSRCADSLSGCFCVFMSLEVLKS